MRDSLSTRRYELLTSTAAGEMELVDLRRRVRMARFVDGLDNGFIPPRNRVDERPNRKRDNVDERAAEASLQCCVGMTR